MVRKDEYLLEFKLMTSIFIQLKSINQGLEAFLSLAKAFVVIILTLIILIVALINVRL